MKLRRTLVAAPALGLVLTGVLAAPAVAASTPSASASPSEDVAVLGAEIIVTPAECGFDLDRLDEWTASEVSRAEGASDPRFPGLTYTAVFFDANANVVVDLARFEDFAVDGVGEDGLVEYALDTDYDGAYDVYYSPEAGECYAAEGFVYDRGTPRTVLPLVASTVPDAEPSPEPTPAPTTSAPAAPDPTDSVAPSPTPTATDVDEVDELDSSDALPAPTASPTRNAVPAGNTDGSDLDESRLALALGALALSGAGAAGLVAIRRRLSA